MNANLLLVKNNIYVSGLIKRQLMLC